MLGALGGGGTYDSEDGANGVLRASMSSDNVGMGTFCLHL